MDDGKYVCIFRIFAVKSFQLVMFNENNKEIRREGFSSASLFAKKWNRMRRHARILILSVVL